MKEAMISAAALVVALLCGCKTDPMDRSSFAGSQDKADESQCQRGLIPPQCDTSGSGTSFFDSCSGEELCAFGPNCNYVTDVTCIDGLWTMTSDTGNEIVCGGIPCEPPPPQSCDQPPQCDASESGTSFFDSCSGEELCAFGPNCNYVTEVTCIDGLWTMTSDTGNEIVCGGIPCN